MKAVGLILIFISAASAGFVLPENYKLRDRELLEMTELIRFVRHEISSYLTTQSEIYEKFSSPFLEKNGFLGILRRLSKSEEEKPFQKALAQCKHLTADSEIYDALISFSSALGMRSPSEECDECTRSIDVLEEIYKKRHIETLEKTKLYRSVGCAVGAGLVLLLW